MQWHHLSHHKVYEELVEDSKVFHEFSWIGPTVANNQELFCREAINHLLIYKELSLFPFKPWDNMIRTEQNQSSESKS